MRSGRAGALSLHLGIDRAAQGRRAVAWRAAVDGRDTGRGRGSVAAAHPRRGAALSHERAGAGAVGVGHSCEPRAPAAIHRRRISRGNRPLPPDISDRRAADDGDVPARARARGAHRFLLGCVRAHGLGAGEREPRRAAPRAPAQGAHHQRLWHDRGRPRRVRLPSPGHCHAAECTRMPSSENRAAPRRYGGPRSGRGRARDEMPGAHAGISQPPGPEAFHRRRLLRHRRRVPAR